MIAKDLKKTETELDKVCEQQLNLDTAPQQFLDRSEDLLSQMNFIAMTNKTLLNLR